MSILNSIFGATIGTAWTAASGTVDPWTKDNLIEEATEKYIAAGMDPLVAAATAESDVTRSLSSAIDPVTHLPVSADPSDATAGIGNSITKLGTTLKTVTDSGSRAVLLEGIGLVLIAVSIYVVPLFTNKEKITL